MVAKQFILANLKRLEYKYRTAGRKDALFFSKLAILELCGWIEESMDDVIRQCAKKHLKDTRNINYVETTVIKRTFAFDYVKFRLMLISVVGLINVEKIEKKLDPSIKSKFEAVLTSLKTARDAEAHTHIKGVTRAINAPSLTIAQFADVYQGLKLIETTLRSTKI